jgi:hypothetical protein
LQPNDHLQVECIIKSCITIENYLKKPTAERILQSVSLFKIDESGHQVQSAIDQRLGLSVIQFEGLTLCAFVFRLS